MHTRARGLRALLTFAALALFAGLAAPAVPDAAASPRSPDPGTVAGGPALAGRGVVVNPAPGVKKLPKVNASSYVIADYDTGAVLAAKDPHGRYRPASTLKILTAATLIPRLDPDDKIKPRHEDCNVEGSKVGLVPKMKYRVDDLFRGLMMTSGNDAALALARGAGGKDRTVRLMNETARRWGAYDTVARNPHGLDRKGQRSSAYDLALITRHALGMPDFRDYVTTLRAKFPAPKGKSYEISTHNQLLMPGAEHYRGAVGVKNGWTSKAKASFVGAARRDGHTLIVVLMHSEPYFWDDARQLLNWGFAAHGEVRPVGALVRPTRMRSPSPEADVPTVPPPTAAAPAAGEPASRDWPLSPVAAGAAVGVVAGALVTAGAYGLLMARRRRRRRRRGGRL